MPHPPQACACVRPSEQSLGGCSLTPHSLGGCSLRCRWTRRPARRREAPMGGSSARRWAPRAVSGRRWAAMAPAASALARRSALSHLHWGLGCAHPCHIRTWTGAHPCHICNRTPCTPAHICAGAGAHPRWSSPLPTSAPGPGLTPAHICAGTGAHPCPRLRRGRGLPPVATSGNALPLFATSQAAARAHVSIQIDPLRTDSTVLRLSASQRPKGRPA
jgi:hypothetical protein